MWRESVPEENWSAYEEEFRPEIREELAEVLERRKGIKGSDVDVAIVSRESRLLPRQRQSLNEVAVLTTLETDQHWDHTGTPSTFPNAKVYLGPNELEHIPTLHSHPSVHVINWDSTLHPPIATFSHSYDVWSDGSLLIVPTPGHTPGHLGALVRSTPPNSTTEEYLLLAGDSCHHTKLLSHHIPQNNAYHLPAGFYEDVAEAERTRDRIKSADRREEVMLVVAHNQEQWKRWNGGDEGVELSGWRERGLKFVE